MGRRSLVIAKSESGIVDGALRLNGVGANNLDRRNIVGVRALYSGHFKYNHSSDGRGQDYNLTGDTNELENLIDVHPRVALEMRSRLRGIVESLKTQGVQGEVPEVDEHMEERLRALGYVRRETRDSDLP